MMEEKQLEEVLTKEEIGVLKEIAKRKRRCKGLCLSGKRCKRLTFLPGGFCPMHYEQMFEK